jgi:hypothetical protein
MEPNAEMYQEGMIRPIAVTTRLDRNLARAAAVTSPLSFAKTLSCRDSAVEVYSKTDRDEGPRDDGLTTDERTELNRLCSENADISRESMAKRNRFTRAEREAHATAGG